MPESKSRRRPAGGSQNQPAVPVNKPNPIWFKPVMFSLMLIGLLWIIVYYITNGLWPIPNITNWNLVIGFGIVIIGFLMTTRWRS